MSTLDKTKPYDDLPSFYFPTSPAPAILQSSNNPLPPTKQPPTTTKNVDGTYSSTSANPPFTRGK